MDRSCIMVIGSGRSGTSLIMRALQAMGARLSDDMIDGSEQNPGGAFEDKEIYNATQALITDINYSVHLPLEADWVAREEVKWAVANLTRIVVKRMEVQDGTWCFKDPKSALLLPMWAQIFNRSKVIPKYIVATRDPGHVCESMHRQYGMDYETAELSWMLRNVSALWDTGGRCYIQHYEDWNDNPEGVMDGLSVYCGLGKPEILSSDIYRADYNRAKYTDYQVKSACINELYAQLKQCRGSSHEQPELMDAVSKCRDEIRKMTGVVKVSKSLLNDFSKKNRRLEQMKKAREASGGNADDLKEARNELARVHDELSGANAALARSREECEKSQGELARLNDEQKDLVLENNRLLLENKDIASELELCRKRWSVQPHPKPDNEGSNQRFTDRKGTAMVATNAQVAALEESTSFRLGNMIVKAFKYPGKNTIALPYRLATLAFTRKGKR